MPSSRRRVLPAIAVLALLLGGCASQGSHFVHPDVDFGFIHRSAVVPFGNLSSDRLAPQRLHSIFTAELLKVDGLAVLDEGETLAAFSQLGLSPDIPLTPEQIVALGERLEVDALFMGTIEEYGVKRSGSGQINEVTAVFSMAETQTGIMVWQAQVHVDGSSFWRKLFGGDSASPYAVSRNAVAKALGTLF